jgi:hypothetical protein
MHDAGVVHPAVHGDLVRTGCAGGAGQAGLCCVDRMHGQPANIDQVCWDLRGFRWSRRVRRCPDRNVRRDALPRSLRRHGDHGSAIDAKRTRNRVELVPVQRQACEQQDQQETNAPHAAISGLGKRRISGSPTRARAFGHSPEFGRWDTLAMDAIMISA